VNRLQDESSNTEESSKAGAGKGEAVGTRGGDGGWGWGGGGILGGGADGAGVRGRSGGVVHWVGWCTIAQSVNAVQNCIGTVQGYQVLQYTTLEVVTGLMMVQGQLVTVKVVA